ncbi:hypothetical protein [Luteimonas aestuarii]|uniref:hypothetical protein n=1 Tax=Luteimonas aestuarii TaxID=453837 RepID=UPI00140452D6|nr:hypothetical protein [Luteimonas aestuarii]
MQRDRGQAMDLKAAMVIAMSLAYMGAAGAATQSDALSRQSDASLMASVEVPVAMAEALSAGAALSVTAVDASGGVVALTISAAGAGASALVQVSAEMARALGIAVGTVVVVTAVSTGWVLSVAGESLYYVANALTRPHLHSRRLLP